MSISPREAAEETKRSIVEYCKVWIGDINRVLRRRYSNPFYFFIEADEVAFAYRGLSFAIIEKYFEDHWHVKITDVASAKNSDISLALQWHKDDYYEDWWYLLKLVPKDESCKN